MFAFACDFLCFFLEIVKDLYFFKFEALITRKLYFATDRTTEIKFDYPNGQLENILHF